MREQDPFHLQQVIPNTEERQHFLDTMAGHYAERAAALPDVPFLKIKADDLAQMASSRCIVNLELAPAPGTEIHS